jgi:DNA repair protein RecN (Recombination protein N)
MLSHIYLKDFAIIEKLDLELKSGMTALTGETGAGKSILIDAIGLVLGDRADSGVVRHSADKAEITLSVDIDDTPSAKNWLQQQDLIDDDMDDQCILRRVIYASGKSRAWINGSPCNLTLLRQLGEQLVDIHGQHEHQSLMKKGMQRTLLDDYAENQSLLSKIAKKYDAWKSLKERFKKLSEHSSSHQDKLDLLSFQIQELNELNLTENETTQLDEEHTRLSNAEQLIEQTSQSVLKLYDNDEQSIYSSISEVLQTIDAARQVDTSLLEPFEMLQNAQILIQEATDSLRRYQELVGLDPERLDLVSKRLSSVHDLSRKHQTTSEQLYSKWLSLQQQLDELNSDDYNIDALQQSLQESETDYLKTADKLTKARQRFALKLSAGVTKAMQTLGMEGGKFQISLSSNESLAIHGKDKIEFMVSANPGQPLKPLQKVASGGELSRISLAIQMIAAQKITLPALIFDEVDSGIGGGIAEVIGQQLRQLGSKRQVLCVTHLPQVASQAHNHYMVSKTKHRQTTTTGMNILSEKSRTTEIARMIGGIEITQSTMNLAEEMLQAAS